MRQHRIWRRLAYALTGVLLASSANAPLLAQQFPVQPPAKVVRVSQSPAAQPPATQPPATQPPIGPLPGLEDSALPPDLSNLPEGNLLPPTPPAPPRRQTLLASAPNMFGDLYSGGLGQVTLTPQPVFVDQVWTNGNPTQLFVTNSGGLLLGANMVPQIPIEIREGPSSNSLIAMSIGDGQDFSGDGQPDLYPISEPTNSSPGQGFTYVGGQAIFGDPATGPQNDSVGNPDNWFLQFRHQMQPAPIIVNVPAGGAAVRRVKLAENNSPQPRDRVFFNYNYFNNVLGGIGDVNRYTFGLERTLGGSQMASWELRLPFASTMASRQVAGAPVNGGNEFGNLTLAGKAVLLQDQRHLIAGGLGWALPTSTDTRVFLPNGDQAVRWNSDSVHVLPYLALLATPSQRCFYQMFCQLDWDINGSAVYANPQGGQLQRIGKIQNAPLMFVDVGGGWLLHENPSAGICRMVHAVAELHYSTTLKDADFAQMNNLTVGSFTSRFDVLNLTLGVNVLTQGGMSIRPAMAIPLRDGDDQQFDYEAMVQMNLWR